MIGTDNRITAGANARNEEKSRQQVPVDLHPESRRVERRHDMRETPVERRRNARRYSDRIAASFTSAFVAQWIGQEIRGDEPGTELALRRSAHLVYAAVQEREAQVFRSRRLAPRHRPDLS